MLNLSLKDLAFLFSPDMERLTPGWLITWYMENELIDISLMSPDDYCEEIEEILRSYIWVN